MLSVGNEDDWTTKLKRSQPMTPAITAHHIRTEMRIAPGWPRHPHVSRSVLAAQARDRPALTSPPEDEHGHDCPGADKFDNPVRPHRITRELRLPCGEPDGRSRQKRTGGEGDTPRLPASTIVRATVAHEGRSYTISVPREGREEGAGGL